MVSIVLELENYGSKTRLKENENQRKLSKRTSQVTGLEHSEAEECSSVEEDESGFVEMRCCKSLFLGENSHSLMYALPFFFLFGFPLRP